jgi:predicted nucleotidyltransferase
MQSVGLITEYNPFHNGHLHHVRESLKVTGSNVSVAVMSGHFLQRGEPALVDKWRRAEMALAAGVDLVVELPLPWACSSAPDFARGGIQALTALGIDCLCFGSETGQIEPLQQCSELLCRQDNIVSKKTAELLRQGMNYPQARQRVVAQLLPEGEGAETLATPNNILGIEYLNAITRIQSPLRGATIKRIGAGYHDMQPGQDGIASATGIRQKLLDGAEVADYLPAAVFAQLKHVLSEAEVFSTERYYQLLLAQIFREPGGLMRYALVENGIENRLVSVAEQAATLEDLLNGLKSRQLTRTRIQRLLVSILLALDKGVVRQLFSSGPLYLHLLAAGKKGRQFLAQSRKQRTVPLVQNFSRIYPLLKRYYGAESENYSLAIQQLDLELRATKIYTLLLEKYSGCHRNRDFYEELRIDV